MEIWNRVTRVPLAFADLLDNSDEAYLITYNSLATLKKDIEAAARERFRNVIAIAQDYSLRAYYVFVKRNNDNNQNPI